MMDMMGFIATYLCDMLLLFFFLFLRGDVQLGDEIIIDLWFWAFRRSRPCCCQMLIQARFPIWWNNMEYQQCCCCCCCCCCFPLWASAPCPGNRENPLAVSSKPVAPAGVGCGGRTTQLKLCSSVGSSPWGSGWNIELSEPPYRVHSLQSNWNTKPGWSYQFHPISIRFRSGRVSHDKERELFPNKILLYNCFAPEKSHEINCPLREYIFTTTTNSVALWSAISNLVALSCFQGGSSGKTYA